MKIELIPSKDHSKVIIEDKGKLIVARLTKEQLEKVRKVIEDIISDNN